MQEMREGFGFEGLLQTPQVDGGHWKWREGEERSWSACEDEHPPSTTSLSCSPNSPAEENPAPNSRPLAPLCLEGMKQSFNFIYFLFLFL